MRLASLAIVATSGLASASPLEVRDCDAPEEIERLVALELRGEHDRVRARIECEGTRVTLRVESEEGTRERSLDLASTSPEVRPRVIALAAVELITPRAAAPPAPPPVASPGPAVVTGAPPPAARATMRVGALASVEVFPGNAGVLRGGGLRAVRPTRIVDVVADVRAHHGVEPVSLGDVRIITVDAALAAGRGWALGAAELRVAAGGRGGAARLAGVSSMASATAFWAPWLGVFGGAGVELRVTSRLRASLGVELGRVVVPVGALVDGVRAVAIDDVWCAAHGGLAASW